ncbi:MAG: metal ABC transporter substrate-binding protein [Betaproteobacteria bacterium]
MRRGLLRLLVAAAMSNAVAVTPAAAVMRVVTTTTDIAALVAVVAGDIATVESIVPPASDPEAFETRPGDIDRVRRADLLVRVGLGYDYWLDALINRIGDKRFMRGGEAYLDASTGIPLLEIRGQSVVNEGGHAHGVANPHYWLDPDNAIIITAGIAEMLIRAQPAQRNRIVAQRARFLADLEARRQRWSQVLAPYAGAKLIAYHNSWPYFARRFRLDIIDFIEPRPGIAPSPAHLAQLIARGRKAGVRAIVHEPYEPEDASRLVALKLGVPLLHLAISVGSTAGTHDYLALFEHNIAALAKALGTPLP